MLRTAFVLILSLFLAACANKDTSDLRDYVKEVNARPAGGIKPIPEVKQVASYLYSVADRRDPFVRQRAAAEEIEPIVNSGIRPDFNRRKEELESYSLDTLRMVGTLEQEDGQWALVKTNDGTIHRVQQGNYMGQNHGRIVNINENRIELIELVRQGGGYLEKEAALALGE